MMEAYPHAFPLSLAPTGMIPTAEMTPHVPLTPEEVATDLGRCLRFGVSSIHVHARDAEGEPTSSRSRYAEYVEAIRSVSSEVVLCASCSGRNDPRFETRSRVLDLEGDLKPDMGSLTLSSLNFAQSASVNAPDTVIRLAVKMQERGIKPELEVFDLGMMNYALYMIDKGYLEPPFYFNIILGNVASAQAKLTHLGAILQDLPPESLWSVGGIGCAQLPANLLGLSQGGGVRVGIEDNLWLDDDRTALARNADHVSRIAKIGRLMDKSIMTPKDFRAALKLS